MVYSPPAVLVVDDDNAICELVCEGLTEEGYRCDVAATADDAFTKLQNHRFDVALLDIRLPGESGMDLLNKLQTFFETTAVVMITAVKDLETAVQAMKLGASDYIVKPFTIDKLTASISTALKKRKEHSSFSDTSQTIGSNLSYGEKAVKQSLSAINAIACGVDAQVDYFDFHSKIVTDKTIDLARRLGLPAKEIENWAVTRNKLYYKRNMDIKSMLSKLGRNPIAQIMLGLAYPVHEFPKLFGEQN